MADLSASERDNLPDSAFAYIEPGGSKDSSGKTVPRSLRHFPVHDKAHADNAAARIAQGAQFGKEALPKVKAAQKKFGSDTSDGDGDGDGRGRSGTRPVERRFTSSLVSVMLTDSIEQRDGDQLRRIGGYAAKFNVYSRDLGHFVEQIGTPCFNKSRGDGWPDVICRFNHDDNQLLGTIAGKTLDVNTDRDGLLYDVEPPSHMQYIVDLVKRRDVQKSSFAFRSLEDEWSVTSDGGPLRTVHSAQLVDVAPVVTPAYADTTAGLRSLADHFDADFEEVRSMAEARELRKFFVRTDRSSLQKPMYPAAAMAQLLERRADPFEE